MKDTSRLLLSLRFGRPNPGLELILSKGDLGEILGKEGDNCSTGGKSSLIPFLGESIVCSSFSDTGCTDTDASCGGCFGGDTCRCRNGGTCVAKREGVPVEYFRVGGDD